MGQPTFFSDADAIAARETDVPAASFSNGMNIGGSCAPGIGINMLEGAIVGTPDQFTLLDQDGDTRDPQVGQQIGGVPLGDGVEGKGTKPIGTGTNPTNAAKEAADPSIDGQIIPTGVAVLEALATGWVDAVTP